jgi:MoaA/NifB/PqqE/SkfB family radical SAM enzyme
MKEIGVAVKITDRCDKMCAHCCENSLPSGQSMPFTKLQKVFEQISKHATRFGITGGEPVLYKWGKKNFLDVMEVCLNLNIQPTVMCGGAYDTYVYRHIFENLIASYKIPFTLSFNLFKPNPEKLFTTAHDLIYLHNYIPDVFITYTEENQDETMQRFENLRKSMHFTANIFKGHISEVGRAKNLNYFKKYKVINRCNSGIDKILFVDMEGLVAPCCEVGGEFTGWKHPMFTQSLSKTLALSNRYCQRCPMFSGIVPAPRL